MNFDSKETEAYYYEKIIPFQPFHIRKPRIKLWTKTDIDDLIELLEEFEKLD